MSISGFVERMYSVAAIVPFAPARVAYKIYANLVFGCSRWVGLELMSWIQYKTKEERYLYAKCFELFSFCGWIYGWI